jgi:hypothetical protein
MIIFTLDLSAICNQRNHLLSEVTSYGFDPVDQLVDIALHSSHVCHEVVPEVFMGHANLIVIRSRVQINHSEEL